MALLGSRRGRHCAEIVFTLLTPGHRTDPVQALKYQSLSLLHRMLTKRPHLRDVFGRAWASYFGSRAVSAGVGLLQQINDAAAGFGWT